MSKKNAVEEGKISLEELEGALSSLSRPVSRRVSALMNIHDKYLADVKSYQAELRALETKYQKEKFAPHFEKRASIISGEYEPTDEEAHYEGEEEPPKSDKDAEDEKGIPQFWLNALQNNNLIASQVFPNDHDALSFITDIRTSNFENEEENGFDITFHFAPNPYFTDSVLTKKYVLDEDEMFGEPVLKSTKGCTINWKPGKNLTVKSIKKKVQSKGKSRKQVSSRSVVVEEPCESFFNFFSPPNIDDDEEVDEDDEEAMRARLELETDFDVATKLKDSIIPYSVLWFTGDAAEYDDFDEDEFGMGEDDDDEEDGEEEEEEDEDEEEQPKGRGSRGGRGGKQGGAHTFAPPSGKQSSIPPPQQPECKQQ